MELGTVTATAYGKQKVVVVLNSSTFFGAQLVATPGYVGYGLLNSVQLNSGSSYPDSYVVNYGNTCIRDKGLNTATLNSSLLGTGLGGNCLVQEGGNRAVSVSSGKLLVTGNFTVDAKAITRSSSSYNVTAYMVSVNNRAISNADSAVLVERNLALEECRMLQVPYYPSTMYAVKSVKDMRLTCN